MAAHVRTVVIPQADREELRRRARSKGAPARVVEQARIVLLAGEGVPGKQIAARVGCAEPTVVTWAGATPSTEWPDWRTCRAPASRPSYPRSCGTGCWS